MDRLGLLNDPLLFPMLKNNPNAENDLEDLKGTLLNSTVSSVGRHGKHFWLRLKLANSQPGVLLMHFGMTGMIKIRDVNSHLVFMENGGDKKILEQKAKEDSKDFKSAETVVEEVKESEEWPPRFVKFDIDFVKGDKKLELAFVDPRRLGRVRFLTGSEVETDEGLMNQKPLETLGPDYSKRGDEEEYVKKENSDEEFVYGDPDPHHHGRPRLSLDAFNKLVLSKKKPIKSLLQEQEYFSGIGNWVSDEIVYNARIHPAEVLSAKLPPYESGNVDPIIARLYESIIYICEESVKIEGDVTKFPENWLMLYRWGKRRKNGPKPKTKEGYEVEYLTVGGRTSCFAPDLQKMLPKPTILKEEEKDTNGKGSQRKKRKLD